jgi:ankyrin repeat protein
MRAIHSKNLRVVEILIDAGADINLGDKQGQSVLTLLCQYNKNKLLRDFIARGLKVTPILD